MLASSVPIVRSSIQSFESRICIGRLVPLQGQHILLRAFPHLHAKGHAAHLTFVADGPAVPVSSTRSRKMGSLRKFGSRRAYNDGAWNSWRGPTSLPWQGSPKAFQFR